MKTWQPVDIEAPKEATTQKFFLSQIEQTSGCYADSIYLTHLTYYILHITYHILHITHIYIYIYYTIESVVY